MARVTSNNASADASKKPNAKRPQLAITAPPAKVPRKESYGEPPFEAASKLKAKMGKTWAMVSCVCKQGKKDPACPYCCKHSFFDPIVKGSVDAQEGEARVHVSASCLCERSNKAGARCRQPEAIALKAVKESRTAAKGEDDDDVSVLTRKVVAKLVGKAESAPGKEKSKEKSAHTLGSNGKQSCLFHCAHNESTDAHLKGWKSKEPIPHKQGPKVGDHFVAMSSILSKCLECERKISRCSGCKKMVNADQHKKGLQWIKRAGVPYHPEEHDEHKKWDKWVHSMY